jgi:CheY-like chemotaxis protein
MRRILIVDDETSIAEALCDVLSSEGFEVDMAPDGRAALERLDGILPDAALVDIMMPVMDGLTLVRQMKSSPALAGIPVVLMSAGALVREPNLQDVPFLRKPFEIDELLQTLEGVLCRDQPAAD